MKKGKTYAWYAAMIKRMNGPAVSGDQTREFKQVTQDQKYSLGLSEKELFWIAYRRAQSFVRLAYFQKRQGLIPPCKWGLGGSFATAKTSVIWVPNIELATTEKAC